MPSIATFLQFCFFAGLIASLCFGLVLLFITIPNTEYTARLRFSKNLIAACFLSGALIFWFTLYHTDAPNFEHFAAMMMVEVTSISAVALSYALINILEEKAYSKDAFFLNIIVLSLLSIVLARFMLRGNTLASKIAERVYVAVYIFQCGMHIYLFIKLFRKSWKKIENYYDEDEYHRLKWLRFCFWIMMASQLAVLVYLAIPYSVMSIYALWYCVFMLYFTINYISFISSHKIVLDAFAHKTLDMEGLSFSRRGEAPKAVAADEQLREREFKKIEKSLDEWVAAKKYREFDKSRDEIAADLDTTKDMLQLYFTLRKAEDFRTWRTKLRIEDAKTMLLEDPKTSTQIIAERSGFSDRSNFHRQFSAIVGCSPKHWRECGGKL